MATRVESGLYGGRQAGSFDNKGAPDGAHPVGMLTRVVSGLYGGRRVGSFADKAIAPIEVPSETHQFFANFDRSLMESVDKVMRRRRDEEEILCIIVNAVTKGLLH